MGKEALQRSVFLFVLILPMLVVGELTLTRPGFSESIEYIFLSVYAKRVDLPQRMAAGWEVLIVILLYVASVVIAYFADIRIRFVAPILMVLFWLVLAGFLFAGNIVWISSFMPIASVVSAYLSVTLLKLIKARRDLQIRAVSLDSLLSITGGLADISEFDSFPEYLRVLGQEIKSSSELHIINPMLDDGSPEYKNFPGNGTGGLLIAYNTAERPFKHRILLELPLLDGNNASRQYTLLGMERRVPLASIKNVAAIIITAYVSFNASKAAEKRSEMFLSLLSCMISAVDAKDPVTSGHSQRVSELSEKLARWMGLPDAEVDKIKFSGLIHDIGKIGIPDRILGKKGPLSDTEFKIMQNHPLTGTEIMQSIVLEPEILDGVLYHHERLDGRGYPYGKAGDELSIVARIIKVADVFDALSSERQYKKAWPLERTLGMLAAGVGTEYDEGVVKTLIANLKPEGFEPPPMRVGDGGRAISSFLLEKCRDKALGLFEKYEQNGLGLSLSHADAPDFKGDKTFGGVEWYDTFFGGDFLMKMPQLLSAEPEIVIFAVRSPGMCTLYYFLRDIMTMGAYVFDKGVCALPQLRAALDEPSVVEDGFYAWDVRRMLVLLWEGNPDTGARVAYIMKSIVDEI